MDKYAEGKVIETATGYIVSIGEPIDVEVTVPEGSTEVNLHAEEGTKWIDINTQYLVTLEVNGVKELYRELWTSGDYDDNNSVSIGNHSYTMDDCYLSDFTEGDVVRIRFEPVEVLTTDAFRAAVKKVAPSNSSDSSGGGSDGGVEFVKFEVEYVDGGEDVSASVICDHTKAELDAAREAGKMLIGLFNDVMSVLAPADEDAPSFVPAYAGVFYVINFVNRTIYGYDFRCNRNGKWSYDERSMDVPEM